MPDTRKENNTIIKNTFALYVRMLFLMLISLYTSRVLLEALGVVDFGIYNVVGGVVLWFSFINSSMTGATQRFLTYTLAENNPQKSKEVFSTALLIHVLIALLVVILAETVGLWFLNEQMNIPPEREQAAFWVYQLSVLSCVVMFTNIPYNATIIARERMDVYALISIADGVLKLAIVFLLKASGGDKLIFYAFLALVVQLLIRVIYYIYCRVHFEEATFNLSPNRALMGTMVRFAGWSLFGNLSAVSVTQGVNILLNIFFGPGMNSAHAIATQVQQATLNFALNFQQAVNPQIIKSYAVDNLRRMTELLFSGSRFSFYLMLLIAMPLFIGADFILDLWLKEVPNHAVGFVRLTLLVSLINVPTNPFMIAANATGNIRKYHSVVGGILLLTLPVSYLFLKVGFDAEVVYVVHIAVSLLAGVFRLFITRGLIHFSLRAYIKEAVVRMVAVALLAAVPPFLCYIMVRESTVSLVACSLLSVVTTCAAIYAVGVNGGERKMIVSKIKQFL